MLESGVCSDVPGLGFSLANFVMGNVVDGRAAVKAARARRSNGAYKTPDLSHRCYRLGRMCLAAICGDFRTLIESGDGA